MFSDLKGFNEGVLQESRCTEPVKRLRHEYTSDCHIISWCALPSYLTLGSDLDSSGYMTDRHLITRLLQLDILEADEFRRSNRHHKLTFNPISLALISRAFQQWIELPLPNHLVHLEPAHIAHVHRHLHLRLHITRSHHDSPDRY